MSKRHKRGGNLAEPPNAMGQLVWARHKVGHPGEVIGYKPCAMVSCTGVRLIVTWPDGELTLPCTKGMIYSEVYKSWEII